MRKPSEFQKTIRVLETQGIFGKDKVVYKSDGSVWFKRPYFEDRGQKASEFAQYLHDKLIMVGLRSALVTFRTKRHKWPQASYLIAQFTQRKETPSEGKGRSNEREPGGGREPASPSRALR